MAHHRHKRDPDARSTKLTLPSAKFIAAPVALVATLAAVGTGVMAAGPGTPDYLAASSDAAAGSIGTVAESPVDISDRTPVVSRSDSRIERVSPLEQMLTAKATAKAVRQADTRLWTTAPLNLWTTPDEDSAAKVGVVDTREKVLVTGRKALDRLEVVIDGKARWVSTGYLTEEKPEKPEQAEAEAEGAEAALGGTCSNGSSVDGQANVLAVHEAVCAAFPEITSYGTYRSDGEHSQGIAIDIMVSGATGWEVAEFVRAHYQELGVSYVMYSQKIWSVERGGEGWRAVADRGSATANHYDHVHVTTY